MSPDWAMKRTPSTYSTPAKRALPATPTRDPRRRRVTIASRPASVHSYRSTDRGTTEPIATRGGPDAVLEEQDDALDHIIMAVDKTGKYTVGCSYYVAREGVLRCMEDIEDAEEGTVNSLKLDIQPTILLLSPRLEISEQEIARSNSLDLTGRLPLATRCAS